MYRPLLTVVGGLVVALGAFLIIAPKMYLTLYLPNYTADFAFAAQRLAPAIMGLGAIMLAARTLPPGSFPVALTLIAACVWAGVAATGLYHYATGVASVGILIAAVTEVILALLFWRASRQMRNA